jgi:hypothetical protein
MCIPIELDVPVLTLDWQEIGTAREILCPCPGDAEGGSSALPSSPDGARGPSDLWLRVTRAARPDLYIPFGEIAETRHDGVRLRVAESEIERRSWEVSPAGLPVPA